jgi:hypothetical protein
MNIVVKALTRAVDLPYGLSPWMQHRLRARRWGFQRENYLYCVERAALEAVALGIGKMSVVEFGVAGGNGLVELERICTFVEKRLPLTFEIFGFDAGTGLPAPDDYRDLPFKWQAGDYEMDEDALRQRLHRSTLVLGDVRTTVETFFEQFDPAPLGAAMFDLDYYSSTVAALKIFDASVSLLLPRVHCYFDDLGTIPSLGVPLAIREFDAARTTASLEQNSRTVHATNPYVRGWKIFELHNFTHPEYERPIKGGRQLPLQSVD